MKPKIMLTLGAINTIVLVRVKYTWIKFRRPNSLMKFRIQESKIGHKTNRGFDLQH